MCEKVRAINYSYLLLRYRARSENELRQRLAKKKFDGDVIEQAISELKELGLINDEQFAKNWIADAKSLKGYGPVYARRKLSFFGIKKELVENAVNKNYSESDEITISERLIKERSRSMKDSDPLKRRRRLYAYLLRRGFSYGTIKKALDLKDDEQ